MIVDEKNVRSYRVALLLLPLALISVSGCSTIVDARKQKAPFISLYYAGDVKSAADGLLAKSEAREGSGDELVWRLDAGTAELDASEYKKSLENFERAEAILKEYRDRAVVSAREGGVEVASAATNANAVSYKGMAVDKIMLNVYKAINYWALGDQDGAMVELRRMRDARKSILKEFRDELEAARKEIDAENRRNGESAVGGGDVSVSFESILQNPVVKDAYESSERKANKLYGDLGNPFVTYLSAIGYLLEGDYGEAMVDFRELREMLPDNKLVRGDYIRCAKEIGDGIPKEWAKFAPTPYPLNTRIVYVLFFNGRAPALKQDRFQIILPFVGYTGIAFPRYEYFEPPFSHLRIDFNSRSGPTSEKTERVVDFASVMAREYHLRMPTMITRLVVSTLTKEIGSYIAVMAARQAGGTGGQIGALALTGFYKWLFNTADTRCWETLPREVDVAHIPIPDDGVLTITPLPGCAAPSNDSLRISRPGMARYGKSAAIKLKKNTKVAIVYVRALSENELIYKLFEQD